MNIADKILWEDPRHPPPLQTIRSYPIIHINAEKISQLYYVLLKSYANDRKSWHYPPLLNPRTNTSSFFFWFFKNLLQLKINILTSVYLEINFSTEPLVKINKNQSRSHLPAPPPPLRIKWSSP